MGLAVLSLGYMAAESAAPWPVEGAAGFVWGAGLVAVGIAYGLKSRNEVPPAGIIWGLVLAMIGWFVPLVFNQLLSWDTLHRFHKLLAFICAFDVFVVWITSLKGQMRRRHAHESNDD